MPLVRCCISSILCWLLLNGDLYSIYHTTFAVSSLDCSFSSMLYILPINCLFFPSLKHVFKLKKIKHTNHSVNCNFQQTIFLSVNIQKCVNVNLFWSSVNDWSLLCIIISDMCLIPLVLCSWAPHFGFFLRIIPNLLFLGILNCTPNIFSIMIIRSITICEA